jgi:hypothetical protein
MKNTVHILLLLLLSIGIGSTACRKKSKNTFSPPAGGGGGTVSPPAIEMGDFVPLGGTSALSSNSVFIVQASGDSTLNGMKFIVPSNAFAGTKGFQVAYAPVTKNNVGPNFNPITPVIRVETNLLYSDSLISVEIPVSVPSGHFAMGFLFNEATGKLEGMPLEGLDSNKVTISTRHFATSSVSGPNAGKAFNTNNRAYFLLASIEESKLASQPVIETGFKVGKDNFEFPNYGSFIEPGGHCTGQCLAAMWYYYEKKLIGAPDLYNQFQMVDKIWQDNPKGYRFSSAVHKDIDWSLFAQSLFADLPISDLNTLRCFAFSMLATGEPQEVGLYSSSGGHSIIAYRVNWGSGEIFVSDPNFPGEVRSIAYNQAAGKFTPYNGAQSAEDDPTLYPKIKYFGKSACYDWKKIGERWKEAEADNAGGNYFPEYYFEYKLPNGLWAKLGEDISVDADTIRIRGAFVSGAVSEYFPRATLFTSNGDPIITVSLKDEFRLDLEPGLNMMGFYFSGVPKGKTGSEYIDFKWNIIRNQIPVTIEDNSALFGSAPMAEFALWVKHNGKLPVSQCRFEWDFGNGVKKIVQGDTAVKHMYTANGSYEVKVKIYQTGQTQILAEANHTVVIGDNNSFLLNGTLVSLGGNIAVGTYIQNMDLTACTVTDPQKGTMNVTFKGKLPGTYVLSESGDASMSYMIGAQTSPEIMWVAQSGTISVLSYGAQGGRITGTFSGTVTGVDYTTDPPTELSGTITNGKFSVYRSPDQ